VLPAGPSQITKSPARGSAGTHPELPESNVTRSRVGGASRAGNGNAQRWLCHCSTAYKNTDVVAIANARRSSARNSADCAVDGTAVARLAPSATSSSRPRKPNELLA
jgi:hypothetical protein